MDGTFVNVGSGVNVLLSVGAGGKVGGMASCVLVDAASAVRTIIVLIAFGSSGGTGVRAEGAHAMIRIKAMHQIRLFLVGDIIILQ